MLVYIFLLGHILLALLIFFLVLAFVTGAPYVPSTNPVARSMIDLAHIKNGMIVYDLGSGDGKLLLLAAAKGAHAIGIEINPYLVLLSKIRTFGKKISVHWGSFWHADLRDSDILFIYLLPWRMEKLAKLLTTRAKPGALVVSNSFIFPNWKIIRQDKVNHVYVFRI
ncbi:hypothetical protein A2875_04140 [Candidatus Gottesmanbacteria bacterium RIFCSPHIGHO2_01_FULL_46_14]|uniref:DOT1 domain-containing protein n=3 Tax=Microgenomates group TaxID=1794810 RepID=A0A1F5ZSK0_9BACT|nr:MAG: hypothetical protein UU34_C0014G0010 [Candidatus Curtissbacteria bacterium GW2011_GWA1_41_11]OGG15450.1 MAG: hypothetical protein A2875_04140 [Candidatus Gottesmanbacteria bacterium RIFCSPHIGHO2_01_FULL_46_14]OGG30202.1 MAG: hypothetical protein A2971_04080 [Candidatus Gottesmanbacteria bacterium RIFCSPLOWO2_01_FULL_46_21]